jgi:hypothetical protein
MQKLLLKELVAAGAVRALDAEGVPGGYVLVAHTEAGARALETQRGKVRIFKSLDAVAALVLDVGARDFRVLVASWSPMGLETTSPQKGSC